MTGNQNITDGTEPVPSAEPAATVADWRTARAYARAQRREQRHGERRYPGLVFGAILLFAGVVALLGQVVPAFDTDVIWAFAL
ncbi:MAG: hypothetical protein ACLQHS_09400, partial [Candidatus Limnocylindrales bacterium]